MQGFDFPLPSAPTPSSAPTGVTEDGVVTFGIMDADYQELIPGYDPITGERDPTRDGRITVSVPMRTEGPFHPEADPHAPKLLGPASDLIIARDLDVGLADLFADEKLRAQAVEARRALDPRRRRP
jgi:hypothetical protein